MCIRSRFCLDWGTLLLSTMTKIGLSAFVVLAMMLFSSACTGEATPEEAVTEEAAMTTDAFIAEANALGYDEFSKKYPTGTVLTLEGEIFAPATWDDKIDAKFGSSLNDLPLTATFMFADNGGSQASTKEKIQAGKTLVFTGKLSGSFYMNNTLSRLSLDSCVAK